MSANTVDYLSIMLMSRWSPEHACSPPMDGKKRMDTAAARAPTGTTSTSTSNTSSEFIWDMARQNRRIEKCFMPAVIKPTTAFAPTVNTVAGGNKRTTLAATTKATNEGLTAPSMGVKVALSASGSSTQALCRGLQIRTVCRHEIETVATILHRVRNGKSVPRSFRSARHALMIFTAVLSRDTRLRGPYSKARAGLRFRAF
ncbi:hypothetical protein [uncultured Agrobacterium sp.]|uniref:hypothetical protein n=1 Tax=uncultured Agrobacterium sp. TaxID=157277 RepID=UPI0025D9D50A|nr:hypothetical protein [uncultured Agrobacterium sp.]